MTRKDFEAMADAFAHARPSQGASDDAWTVWNRAVQGVADHCTTTNPRFDRGRFISACDNRAQ